VTHSKRDHAPSRLCGSLKDLKLDAWHLGKVSLNDRIPKGQDEISLEDRAQ
jgi:hypothetical protein